MILAHLRLRRRVSLLAAGALEGAERKQALDHVSRCSRCRADYEELSAVVHALEADPLREAEPELPLAVLVDRVERRLEQDAAVPPRRSQAWLVALPVAAATIAAVLVLPTLVDSLRPLSEPTTASIPALPPPTVSQDTLARLERNVAREHTARYLSEASELLVAVAATGLDGDRQKDQLDLGEAPEKSRALLEKARLVVDQDGEAVASAQGVLDDVELALREVAGLPSCVSRRDVERVRAQVERRQLLMRIRLMTRELEG